MFRTLLLIVFFASLTGCWGEKNIYHVSSPEGNINAQVSLNKQGQLLYQVDSSKSAIIAPSHMGFTFKNHPPLENFEVVSSKISAYDNTWLAPWGERKHIANHYNQLFIELKEKQGDRQINIRLRVFNDGIGFRYEFPQQPGLKHFVIMDEKTEFKIAENSKAWWIKADYNSYEKDYHSASLAKLKHAQTPLTLKTSSGRYLSIHEAALTDYASMTLLNTGNNTLKAELAPWKDGSKVKASAPFITPWRTINIASSATDLAQSDLLLNLNEPSRITDTHWIKPMKFIGVWWGMHLGIYTWKEGVRHGATTKRAKEYIDFAAKNNISGVLFEGWNKGWGNWGQRDAYVVPADDFNLQAVARYAKSKGVTIIGHNETGGNVEAYEKNVEEIFSLYHKLGISAVKTGYVAEKGYTNGENHQGQWAVNQYRRIVKLAAKYHIMLDVHEPIKDTGIRRTWPNLMTREGAKGGEWNAWSAGNDANYTQILPFTRLLAGPMDYTVGIFDIDYSRFASQRFDWSNKPQAGNFRVHTTLSHQLANIVTLYSPLQMMADMIENYKGHPAFKFIRDFNPDTDDSRVLAGEIGQYIAVARRTGKNWVVGVTTGNKGRDLSVALDFLKVGQQYRAEIYQDSAKTNCTDNAEAYEIVTQSVNNASVLKLHLADCGGAAIRLEPL